MRPVRTALLAALAIALAPGMALAAKDELVIGVSQYPTGFHPSLFSHVTQSLILGAARRPFTAYDSNWNLICMLCTELPSRENGTARETTNAAGGPGMEVDYTIRPDAVWGDGTPITTKDVLFTWKVGRTEEAGIGNQELYRNIENIKVIDDKSFTLQLDRRECDFASLGDFEILPAHLEAAAFAEPREYKKRTLYETDTTNPGLYFGPYRITRVEPGALVVLEPNPTWWGAKPQFNRVIFRIIENTAALEANLLSGEIDYIAGEDGVTLDQALAFERRYGNDYQVVFKPGLIYEHIDVMLDNPILKDVRVRQALMYAANRQGISERLFEGKQPVADSSVNPLDSVYYDDVPKYPYDPARAITLLEDAGWTELRDGFRYNAAGERLTFEIMTTAGNRTRELVEVALQSMWAEVGVDLRIRNQPARVLFGQTLRQREFSAMAMFAWVSSPENIPWTTLRSDMIPNQANNFSGQNYTGYRSPAMDDALDRIRVECAPQTQAALWQEIQTRYAEDLPALPLYFRANAFIMPKWLQGVTPTGNLDPSTLWIETWRSTK